MEIPSLSDAVAFAGALLLAKPIFGAFFGLFLSWLCHWMVCRCARPSLSAVEVMAWQESLAEDQNEPINTRLMAMGEQPFSVALVPALKNRKRLAGVDVS